MEGPRDWKRLRDVRAGIAEAFYASAYYDNFEFIELHDFTWLPMEQV